MRTGKRTVLGRLEADRLNVIENNVMLLAFYRSTDNSKAIYSLDDGFIDEYEDESGVDTVASLNELYNSTDDYYGPDSASLDTAPYAHYKCNDNAGNTTVTDDGTGSNNGTSSTNTSNLTSAGKINEAFDLNGTTEYIDIDLLEADIASDTSGSFCLWLNANATGATEVFTISDASANTHLSVRVNPSVGELRVNLLEAGSQLFHVFKTGVINSGTMYHFALVQDGVAFKIYIDGELLTGLTTVSSIDNGAWMADMSTLDTGRIGCASNQGAGNASFFGGKIDDFRYYQNKALSLAEVQSIYNSGSGTEESQPAGEALNMTLISDAGQTADTAPDTARLVIFEEDVDAITLNTDLLAYVSRDGGSNWTQGTLENDGNYASGQKILTCEVDISGQPSDTDMEYKLVTANNKDLKVHGVGLNWA